MKIIHHDAEREFVVIDKPGSIVSRSLEVHCAFSSALQPVHAAGRYFRHTLVEILMNEFGYDKIYSKFPHLIHPSSVSIFLISREPFRQADFRVNDPRPVEQDRK